MRKRSIVLEYASMWPREILDIRCKNSKRLWVRSPECPLGRSGVYVLYRDDRPYYIGKATRLAERIWAHANHPTDPYYNFWNLFSAFVVKDLKQMDQVEGILIAALPTANSSTPRITRLRLPLDVSRQLRLIRHHEANPLTQKELARLVRAMQRPSK